MKLITCLLCCITLVGCGKVQADGPEVFWVSMPCTIDTTVPIRVELQPDARYHEIDRVIAESQAFHTTVWTDSEWRGANISSDVQKQITDFCRDILAKSWGYTKIASNQ